MITFFRILLGIGLVGGATYFLAIKNNNFSYNFTDLGINDGKIIATASTTMASVKTKTVQAFSDISSGISNKAYELAGNLISSAVEKAKDYAIEAVKQSAEEGLNKLGDRVGININSSETPTDNYVIYSVKKDTNAYFTIKNSEDGILKYNVNWLDDKIDSGQLNKKDEFVVLVHSWSKPGEYLINFKISNVTNEKTHKVLISVLN